MSAPKDPEKYALWKQRMSEARKGKTISEESRKNMSDAQKGKPKSEEHKKKLSESKIGKSSWNKGIPHTEETKEKMRQKKLGIKLSEETKLKMGIAHKGQVPVVTEESKEKNRQKHLGKKASDETKQKMSESHMGRVSWNKGIETPLEVREKMSSASKGKPKSEKHRENMKGCQIGLIRSEETRSKQRGSKNHNWKDGITPLIKAIRKLPESIVWREEVFKRDNYTDYYSQVEGGILEAHHIISFVDIIERNKIKNINDAVNCKELWDVNNGITMSKTSHLIHHSKFGNLKKDSS